MRDLDRCCYELLMTGDPDWAAAARQIGVERPYAAAARYVARNNAEEEARQREETRLAAAEAKLAGLRLLLELGRKPAVPVPRYVTEGGW